MPIEYLYVLRLVCIIRCFKFRYLMKYIIYSCYSLIRLTGEEMGMGDDVVKDATSLVF